ncbi:hypothetical protein ACOMCU_24040, partial [Lysinibacillus sp. UGB7]|uniref:hypothetical protein n=1 Tax=Lysinibacillus sp. UGB7 TaxID=3411039 RepID=UPI003B77A71B
MCESEATATGCLCAKAKRQQQDVGHEGVITGRDAFSLRSSNGSRYQGTLKKNWMPIFITIITNV